MNCGTDIRVHQRMTPTNFGDLLTFPLASPAGQSFYLFREISQHHMDETAQNFEHL